ncbi:NAD(P)-dependent oxidoreductase [Chromobacterium sp. IIBBL 290-4]|uniref:NAD(P)-dependent oxidoreductase n=1 Tax=Chromobacterium sp. IIBBL 290-4 TaxID=2953890 RepID=UPI0020B7DD9E|nr:NAD(P)-dependent oxidoreductase [Chromobacterium sp. IIBBL 290-4]UTH75805.1 NAD(P)-dependent oxidoreductase [Chromobacterium sp. IIBBL 290-4]
MSPNPTPSIAVLGTGIIGSAIARNLVRKGFAVRAWNRTPDKAQALMADGATACGSAADAARGADVIITAGKDGAAVASAMRQAEAGLKPEQIWLQLATIGLEATAELSAWAAQRGLIFYDAPVVGTRQPAEAGQLVMLASGPLSRRDQAQNVFDAISRRAIWISEQPGDGSRLKLVINNWVLALTHGAAETLALAQGLGLDPALALETIAGGPLDAPYLQLKGKAMLAGDYSVSFSVDNAAKDAGLVLAAAEAAGVRMDGAAAGLARFQRAIAAGHGGKDMAATFLA